MLGRALAAEFRAITRRPKVMHVKEYGKHELTADTDRLHAMSSSPRFLACTEYTPVL